MNSTPSAILARLVRRFGLLVLLTGLGAGAGGAYGALKTPTYRAQAYVVLTAEPGEPGTAVNFAQAYGRIVTGGPVADAAAKALGSRAGLAGVTATTSPDAPVIEITATGTAAKRTADVANAVAKALADYATAHKAETRVSGSVLAPAAVPAAPSSPKPPLELAVGGAAGLLVAGLAALAGVGRARRGETAAVGRDTGQDLVALHPAESRTAWAAASVATAFVSDPAGPAGDVGPPPKAVTWSAAPVDAVVVPPVDAVVVPPDEPQRSAVGASRPGEQPKIVGRAVVIRRELS